jgi:hypothetical protein
MFSSPSPWLALAVPVVVAIGIAVYQRFSSKPDRGSKGHKVTAGKSSPLSIDSPVSADLSGSIKDSQVAVGANINQTREVHHHYEQGEKTDMWAQTEITPQHIWQEIGAALPFDKAHAREKYIGLRVVWGTTFSSVYRYEKFSRIITVWPHSGGFFPQVSFELTEITPEVRSVTDGSLLLINGTIRSVGDLGIELMPDPLVRVMRRS